MGSRAWLWTVALLLVLPTAARAEDGNARAAALFREGRAAMEREDLTSACPLFKESAKLDPAPGTLLNLALCQEGLGKIGSAFTNFSLVVALLPPGDERVPFAKEHAADLEPRVASLTLELAPSTPDGATVLRDGEEIARADLGVADAVDPGAHEVTLRIPGEHDVLVAVSLREGERRTVVMGRAGNEGAEGAAAPFPRRTVGLVLGGVGAASLTVGLITGAIVLDKKATVEDSCHGTSMCDTQEGVDAAAAGSTLSTISTITFITGIAALGVGAYLFFTSETPGQATAIGPAVVPGGVALHLWRTF